MRACRYFFVVLMLSFAGSALAIDHPTLPAPEESLSKRIAFWVKIYSELSTSQGVVHDAKYPEIIYETMDFTADQQNFTVATKTREKNYQNRIIIL